MEKRNTTYRLTLKYGLISFLAMAVAAVCILLFFRYQTTQVIEDASRRSNEVLTVATEYALNDHFVMLLNFVGQKSEITNNQVTLEPMLSKAIQKLRLNTSVERIKIYNLDGTVVYSSKASQIGEGMEENEGFQRALKGETTTVLIYRDTFNVFDQEQEDENMVQTYVPIRLGTTGEVKGVLEIYSDVSDYIYLSERTILLVTIIVLSSIFILYIFLLLHVKRSEIIINNQNKETRERNRMLEYLTAKMINAQEDERRRIAYELHEDVVQTISGVKMQLERYITSLTSTQEADSGNEAMTRSIVPVLQEAAQKIRMVAMDIRPPSLDDFGLKAAIDSLVSECLASTTGMEVNLDIRVAEDWLTMARKSILYRMIKDMLRRICFKYEAKGRVGICLKMQDEDQLVLQISITSQDALVLGFESLPDYLETVQEQTILSGGKFNFTRDENVVEAVSHWHG